MTRHILYPVFAVIFLLALGLTSCRKMDDGKYSISPKSIYFGRSGGKKVVRISSNSDWTLSADCDWVRFTPTSGSGPKAVEVTILENATEQERKVSLNLIGRDGSVRASVLVTQDFLDNKIDNIIIAHRGAYKEFGHPDNSLAALKQAVELGTYGSECDINITSDNQVVVVHGETFGGLPILNNSYATLKSRATLANGEPLPLLSDFLKVIMEGQGTKLVLDIKSLSDEAGGNAQSIRAGVAAAKLIESMGAMGRVMFIVGRLAVFNGVINEVGGQWPVAYMNSALTPAQFKNNTNGLTSWANFDITALGKNASTGAFDPTYLEAQVDLWNKAGIEVSLYNIDTEQQIQWYLPHKETLKACTNYPLNLLKRVGKR